MMHAALFTATTGFLLLRFLDAHLLLNLIPPPPLEQDLRAEDYTYTLSPVEVSEIIAGTDALLARGIQDEEDIKKVGRGSGRGVG
jgi:hypothetical protein